MFKQIVICILLSITFSSNAQEWKQDDHLTKVVFVIKNFGVNVDGNFKEVKIFTNFNSNQLQESYVRAEIVVKSLKTGIESRDEYIFKKAYFDENTHKKIYFRSYKIEKNKDGTFSLFADLTMKGITKKINVLLKVLESNSSLNISSNFTINRKDFNINGGGFVLSNKVKINVNFKGNK